MVCGTRKNLKCIFVNLLGVALVAILFIVSPIIGLDGRTLNSSKILSAILGDVDKLYTVLFVLFSTNITRCIIHQIKNKNFYIVIAVILYTAICICLSQLPSQEDGNNVINGIINLLHSMEYAIIGSGITDFLLRDEDAD